MAESPAPVLDDVRPYIVPLADCRPDGGDQVGGKALGLGSLTRLGLPVPDGFVVTTCAYRRFLELSGIGGRIRELLAGAEQARDTHAVADQVMELFTHHRVPDDVRDRVLDAYDSLGGDEDALVAVRSSATAEDTAAASFAGQQETYLWVRGTRTSPTAPCAAGRASSPPRRSRTAHGSGCRRTAPGWGW